MTRPIKKAEEREIVERLLSAIHLNAEIDDTCEKPDIILEAPDRPKIGVEVTMYASSKVVGNVTLRQVEAAWESVEFASREFRNENPILGDVAIIFRFRNVLPEKKEYSTFFQEIRDFVVAKKREITAQFAVYSSYQFTSPLMTKYLTDIAVNLHKSGEWDSNKTSGFVDRPANTIAKIISEKASKAKFYRKTQEIWLVIARSPRPSEFVLPISGIGEFSANVEIFESLKTAPFSRVYVFTAMGLFCWLQAGGWQVIGAP
jgi:hypothetical protein